MKRTKEWWHQLTKQERSRLVYIERNRSDLEIPLMEWATLVIKADLYLRILNDILIRIPK